MLTVNEVKAMYENAKRNAKTPQSIKAYEIAIGYLSILPKTLKVNPRSTVNDALNVGDVGEMVMKYLHDKAKGLNKRVIYRSIQGERDIKEYHKSEVKTFTVHNRPANPLTKKIGFNALTPQGLAWIPYTIAKNYVKLNERIKLSTVYQIINENEIEILPLESL